MQSIDATDDGQLWDQQERIPPPEVEGIDVAASLFPFPRFRKHRTRFLSSVHVPHMHGNTSCAADITLMHIGSAQIGRVP